MTIHDFNMTSLIDLASELKQHDFEGLPIVLGRGEHKFDTLLKSSDLTHATSSDKSLRKEVAENIRAACLTAGFFFGRRTMFTDASEAQNKSRIIPCRYLPLTGRSKPLRRSSASQPSSRNLSVLKVESSPPSQYPNVADH